ncbi:SMP-30/gluconolactonase/LRE family protein [Sorangium sp. So ce1151]|uniref:SMP-30/gluconolactonase/LRE family protein n=1 Tax=Sorangium sp. So ce1151 TaxID=3133332 RepID=UPI003F5FE1A3
MARLPGTFTPVVVVAAMASCGGEAPPRALAPAASAPPAAPAAASSVESPPAPPSAPVAPSSPRLTAPSPVATYTGFAMPESVLYDADNDRYLVSNVNGNPSDKDNNGFISVLSPDGQVTNLRWIEGGKNKVKLDAPTGSAIVKGVLYVADLKTVRMFDLTTGAPKGEIAIPGATLLNDVAAAPDGTVYVSDSGFTIGATGNLEATSSDAVYVIEKGKARLLAKTTDMHMPNGIAWTDRGLVVCSSGAPEVFRLDEKGARQDVTTTAPGGRLDGLVSVGDSLLVTSHEASAVLRGKLGGPFEIAIPEQKTPTDIGYDTKRGRVLVPHVMEDRVDVHELK